MNLHSQVTFPSDPTKLDGYSFFYEKALTPKRRPRPQLPRDMPRNILQILAVIGYKMMLNKNDMRKTVQLKCLAENIVSGMFLDSIRQFEK